MIFNQNLQNSEQIKKLLLFNLYSVFRRKIILAYKYTTGILGQF